MIQGKAVLPLQSMTYVWSEEALLYASLPHLTVLAPAELPSHTSNVLSHGCAAVSPVLWMATGPTRVPA